MEWIEKHHLQLFMGTQNFFLCPTLMTRQKISYTTYSSMEKSLLWSHIVIIILEAKKEGMYKTR